MEKIKTFIVQKKMTKEFITLIEAQTESIALNKLAMIRSKKILNHNEVDIITLNTVKEAINNAYEIKEQKS